MALIWTCPDHDTDLEPFDGIGLWCTEGEHYEDVAIMAQPDPDDQRDLLIDVKEMAR